MSARKRQVLDKISFADALNRATVEQPKGMSMVERRRTTVKAMSEAGHSAHQIARELCVSHTTVLRDLKAITGETE
jgi:DNA-binding NarL/FixJ family response regulator